MNILHFYGNSVNDRYAAQAAETLRGGELILYPTDTHYALGCSALNRNGVRDLARAKGVDPDRNNLTIVCADISQASQFVRIDDRAFSIVRQYTPGAVTFIMSAAPHLAKTLKGRKTVGVRIPDNMVDREIARMLGSPILSASLPLDSELAADPDAVGLAYADSVRLMADNGPAPGVSSTIVDLTDSSSPVILRQGAVPVE